MVAPSRAEKASVKSLRLGPLEARIMAVIWERGESGVREVMPYVGPLAYTTVMTTMARLYKKGFLDRYKEGFSFVYRSRFTKEGWRRKCTEAFLDEYFSQSLGTDLLVSTLLDTAHLRDKAVLAELERKIRLKRQELNKAS
jgi:predicted transcriptional regulator